MNIFIRKSSRNSIFSLWIWKWNLTKCKLASSPSWPLNFGSHVFKSIQGIRFEKPGIWAWFIGAYLRVVESILTKMKSPRISSDYQFLKSGVSMKILNLWILWHWSHQVKGAQPSHAWSLFTISNQIWSFLFFPREDMSLASSVMPPEC